ncbi:hypothetical protein Pan216_50980 [Planctomycetes bacterium Pan216]|uniref:DUF1501 domain-containing protein n=1 Tax=Kolteria novifilia TaxID=2527975 RepID=A0A518BB59_9BACT|nr:hypothetical protein Pan216_50980 [Planctomycetes bacterium Pan216]
MAITRRHFVKHMTAAGSMALPMSQWIQSAHAARESGKAPKTRSMILLWMSGGPATIDIWDLKPGSKNGGEFKPIQTTGSGQICEHLPQLAKQMKHLNIIRSYSSREADHARGTYLNHTGFPPLPTVVHPAIGACVAKFNSPESLEIPGNVSLGAGGQGVSPGFLGMTYAPFRVNAGRPVPNTITPVSDVRHASRAELWNAIETGFVKQRRGGLPEDHSAIYGKAHKLMGSTLLDAFDISKEPENMQARYGDHQFGKSCLLARRLVENGVPFIEVGLGGWDMHNGIFEALAGAPMNGGPSRLKQVDDGFSALVEDLVQRGLWETTTIVWMGDFGRTPKINIDGGRDHWPRCWSVVLGGGGMKGGEVVGATDKDGVAIVDEPVEVSNLFASLYKSVGIEPTTELRSPNGRPLRLSGLFGDGQYIKQLF